MHLDPSFPSDLVMILVVHCCEIHRESAFHSLAWSRGNETSFCLSYTTNENIFLFLWSNTLMLMDIMYIPSLN